MNNRGTLVAFILLLITLVPLAAQNPILGPSTERSSEDQSGDRGTPSLDEQEGGVFDGRLAALVRRWSNTLQRRIAELSRRVRSDGDVGAAIVAFFAAVLFGAIHIAGPGHGKVFALSYFSSREARPADGIAYSVVVNIIDSLSAFVIVFVGYVVLRAVAPAFRTAAPKVLEIASYSTIIVFGVAHLLGHLFGHHSHDHPPEDEAAESPKSTDKTGARELKPWMLAITVGLIPCPVSTILLVYGVVNDVLGLMILMVAGVSVGGFLTMSAISLAVIAGRKGILSRLSSGAAGTLTTVLEYLASALIIAVGGLLLFAALL